MGNNTEKEQIILQENQLALEVSGAFCQILRFSLQYFLKTKTYSFRNRLLIQGSVDDMEQQMCEGNDVTIACSTMCKQAPGQLCLMFIQIFAIVSLPPRCVHHRTQEGTKLMFGQFSASYITDPALTLIRGIRGTLICSNLCSFATQPLLTFP